MTILEDIIVNIHGVIALPVEACFDMLFIRYMWQADTSFMCLEQGTFHSVKAQLYEGNDIFYRNISRDIEAMTRAWL